MSKHTPGPWTAYESLGCMMVANSKGEFIEYPLNGPPTGEQLATAALIAAAPELLEACRVALLHINGNCDPFATATNTLIAAIAKAEGK